MVQGPKAPRLQVSKQYAPVNAVPNVRSGTYVAFAPGRRPGCVKITARFRIAQIVQAPSTAGAPYTSAICFSTYNGNYTFIMPISIVNSFYWPSYFTNLTRLFSFYYAGKANLQYEPRTTTATSLGFVMGFIDDPEWLEDHNLLSSGKAVPTETALTTRGTACTSNTWSGCRVSATGIDTKTRYYTGGSATSTEMDFSTENPATIRQSVNGMFAVCSAQALSASTSTQILGDVYINCSFELCDFSLALTSSVSLAAKRAARRAKEEEKQYHLVTQEREDTPSPTPSVKSKSRSLK